MKKKSIVDLTHCSVAEYRAMEKRPLALLADNVRSMYNVGSILRTCDAFRVAEVILAGITPAPSERHREITKTALGAEESVAWRKVENAAAEVARMKAAGWTVCVLEQVHGSVPLPGFRPDPSRRYLLVVGNEVEGVAQTIVDMADVVLEIPQEGTKHSLNVASSSAIALYAMLNFEC